VSTPTFKGKNLGKGKKTEGGEKSMSYRSRGTGWNEGELRGFVCLSTKGEEKIGIQENTNQTVNSLDNIKTAVRKLGAR